MDKEVQLRLGEKVMSKAPMVKLSNGEFCIPQHYLTYHHTLQSVEALICAIEYDPRYVVFAAQDGECIYIQVGVVGHDNYKKHSSANELKLLLGRKWRVEPELPTSEIIQSVFLAIKKSREHEVRELFKLKVNNSVTTPFNTHIDLPLMAQFYENKQFQQSQTRVSPQQQINHVLSCINYDNCILTLKDVEQRKNGLWLIDVGIECNDLSTLPEIKNKTLFLQTKDLTLNTLSRALMNELVFLSDLHVDQNFSYQGFHRCDPAIDIAEIADLSQQTRKHELAAQFASEFSKSNYETDQMRIPPVKPGPLAKKHQKVIEQFHLLS
ncbi:hypothetical protein CJF42_05115 [Pseudoalteromonas sp. NBT06-2]|uniref:hypothetical protein n=1 Tax=Pseudoalteromonas sp. NBT06-2 TaxID=2025950 RepID=UPI000BA65B39|nr:hypothetical protein [Pseudoalteromonas sp. NBT06-2]PAJ75519.1 hypothetical protein CJF42_05115 [Pseudoalteromonas sp. NBT06-2]